MTGPSGLKLGGLVQGMCPNVLMKECLRSVNGRGKMSARDYRVLAYRLGDGLA